MFSYDTADNLVSDTGTTQQFNAADELCWTVAGSSGNACGTAPAGATTYGYDLRGNRTSQLSPSGAATCNVYDQAGRLTSVVAGTGSSCTSPTTVATYAYDASGLRMSKTVAGTTTTQAWDLSGSLPLLLTETSGGVASDYVDGPGGLPLEQISSGGTLWYHHDQLGSARVLTNSAGAAVATYQYDPYGVTVASTGTAMNPLQYAGQYRDTETGRYYMRDRFYDPTTAEFLTQDPFVSSTLSPYAYVAGDPINESDATGECPFCIVAIVAIIGLVVVEIARPQCSRGDQTCILGPHPPTPIGGEPNRGTVQPPVGQEMVPGGTVECTSGTCWVKNVNRCGWSEEPRIAPEFVTPALLTKPLLHWHQ